MKILSLIVLLTGLLATTAYCEQGIYRNKDGGYAGSWSGNDYQREYRGSSGGYVGSAERDGSGWTFKDSGGGYAGGSSGNSDRSLFIESEDD